MLEYASNVPKRVIRTPDDRFKYLHDYPFKPNFVTIRDGDLDLQMHFLDEGPRDGEIILCLHGQPTWSYLYRKMIPILCSAGYRVIAPDLIGFGKSDKLTCRSDYSYAGHVSWMEQFMTATQLAGVTLVGQDWGGKQYVATTPIETAMTSMVPVCGPSRVNRVKSADTKATAIPSRRNV